MKKPIIILLLAVFSQLFSYFLLHYYVQPGDTLFSISKDLDVSISTILDWNDLEDPRKLSVGEELLVPIPDGILYEVKRGDTLYDIARRFFTSADLIKAANSLTSDFISAGQKLFIPSEIMGIASNDSKHFIWPVYGKISSYYGWRIHPIKKVWSFHTGLDIAAPLGSPVFAADDGIVKFAGRNGGYGLMILIDHGTYQTVYAHLSKIDVFKGQYVKKGQLIGRVGSTGISTGPHLHFEVRYKGKHTDPLAFLPSPKRMYVLKENMEWMGGE